MAGAADATAVAATLASTVELAYQLNSEEWVFLNLNFGTESRAARWSEALTRSIGDAATPARSPRHYVADIARTCLLNSIKSALNK